MEDLDAASLDDVKAFFRTYYAPNNAVLSLVGDIDPAEARAWVKRYFGNIPANPNIPQLGDLSLPPTLGEERRRRSRRPCLSRACTSRSGRRCSATTGSTRSRSRRRSSPAGKGSRLHRRLVREDRIAQDVILFTLGFTGGASVTAGWATARPGIPIERVEAALLEELERLGRELVTDDEMVRARALVETDELGALQRVEERADRLSMYATLFDDPGLVNTMLARYLAVTPEAIRDVAASVFRADNRAVVTYLPAPGSNAGAEDGTAAEAAAATEEVAP